MQTHDQFFTSLKHLEKRLKLESHPSPPPTELATTATQQSDSLGTPIYLNPTPTPTPTSTNPDESEPPNEFISASSPDFPPTLEENQRPSSPEPNNGTVVDRRSGLDRDIELLMRLLSLSEVGEGFYERIAGARSAREVERLNGWIEFLLKDGEKREPLGLAHLLLGKAGFVHGGGFVFPSTIDEFLRNDPPVD